MSAPKNCPHRLAALEAGRTRYFTGEPCAKGHLAERRVSSGCCVVCQRHDARRRYRAKHPDFVSARGRPLVPDPPPRAPVTEGSAQHGN